MQDGGTTDRPAAKYRWRAGIHGGLATADNWYSVNSRAKLLKTMECDSRVAGVWANKGRIVARQPGLVPGWFLSP